MRTPRPDLPPAFLRLSAHPLRWSLLCALSQSDRLVDELENLTGQPQNLVSYHLGKLRAAEMVSARRSSQDGREVYYRLDAARCAELYAHAGSALHPAFAPGLARWNEPREIPVSAARRVLFLCTENSARSQMAEGYLRHLSRGSVPVASAGSLPGRVHPFAIEAMQAMGIDIRGQRSKHIDELAGQEFDTLVTVCDRERERCPEFANAPELRHWSIPDPAIEPGGQASFEQVAAEIAERVALLLRTFEGSSAA